MSEALLEEFMRGILSILMLAFLFYIVKNSTLLSSKRIHAYLIGVVLTMLAILCENLALWAEQQSPQWRWVNVLSNLVGFGISPAIPLLIALVYDEKLLGKPWLLWPVLGVNALLFLTTPWTGWMFSISRNNEYSRGPLFLLYVAACAYGLGLFIVANDKQAKRMQRGEQVCLALMFAIVVLGLCVQIIVPQAHTSWYCVTLALIMYYCFLREVQSKYDPLTQTLNRAAYEKALLKMEKRVGGTIVMLDLDEFKSVNDQSGHQAGDECLRGAAQIICDSFSRLGNCYRVGGDEFCVLSTRCDQNALEAAERAMMEKVRLARREYAFFPYISYGSCIYHGVGDIQQAINKADQNMYFFKKRNGTQKQNSSCEETQPESLRGIR